MTEPTRQIERAEVGFWTVRYGKNTPRVPAAIMWVETLAEPGCQENDMRGTRSRFLAAFIAGEPVDIEAVWHRKGAPISEEEYRFLCAEAAWSRANAPEEPAAQPMKRVDLSRLPVPF